MKIKGQMFSNRALGSVLLLTPEALQPPSLLAGNHNAIITESYFLLSWLSWWSYWWTQDLCIFVSLSSIPGPHPVL